MRRAYRIRRGLVLALVGWPAVTLSLLFFQSQIFGQSAIPPSSHSAGPTVPKATDRKSTETGVWHHFGEGTSVPAGEPHQNGVWRHFGKEDDSLLPPRELPSRRTPELSATCDMEHLMLALVNRDRADPANAAETKGRALPLRWNDRLAEVARAHSLDMLNQGYFGHIDPQGGTVATRVESAGMEWQAVGENIAIYNSVAGAEAAFMNEPRFTRNHRGNILNPDYTEAGIGIVQAPDGRVYITQDFYNSPTHPGAR